MSAALPIPLKPDTEGRRRQWYVAVASLASVIQLGIAVADALRVPGRVPVEAGLGALVCGVAALLLRLPRTSWRRVDVGILLAASGCVAWQVLTALRAPGPPEARLTFTAVFLFVAGYSVLPARWATAYALGVFTAFAGLSVVRGGDLSLLAELGLSGVLIAHLSTFGRRISVERAEAAVYHRLAHTDALTGLENRRAMTGRLGRAFADPSVPPVTALLLDIDHFKGVNDRYGHDLGDEVLMLVTERLRAAVGQRGHVARWGGEEFLVAVPGRAGAEEASRLAEAIRQAISAAPAPGLPAVTVSIGLARQTEVDSVRDLLRLADARLYRAKEDGRDRVEQVHPGAAAQGLWH